MKKLNARSAGFTLIELMIVFVIIIVLAGMVLRLMGLAGTRNAEAVTRERLERVAQAIEEFRATYGQYPPVAYYPYKDSKEEGEEEEEEGEVIDDDSLAQPFEYEYADAGSMPSGVQDTIKQVPSDKNLWSADGTGRVFTFGLLSYLFPRYNSHAVNSPGAFIGRRPADDNEEDWKKHKYKEDREINQWGDHNERRSNDLLSDNAQNVESARRIVPYLGASLQADGTIKKEDYGIVENHSVGRKLKKTDAEASYFNRQLRIRDGWGRMLRYQSRPPYDSYKLWSIGPDGKTGTRTTKGGVVIDYSEDDIVVGEG